MNITFLIGNGFDVNLGLKTRYEDFYNYLYDNKDSFSYVNKIEEQIIKDIDNYVVNNKNKEQKEKLWKDFELGLGKYTEKINDDEVDDFIAAIIGLKNKLAEYLEKETRNSVNNFEGSSIQIVMRESITRFKTFLSKKAQRTLGGLEQTYGSENWEFNFLSFNYTDTLDTLLNKAFTNKTMGVLPTNSNCQYIRKQLIHIHGTLDRYMILGVNDQSQIANEKIRSRLLHSIIKPQINDDAEDLINETASDIIMTSQVFIIFGMSIGETDKKWWKLIYNRMQANANIYLVIIDYISEYDERHAEFTQKSKEIVIQKFIKVAEIKDEHIDKISNRIIVKFNSNMFKIKKINSNQIIKDNTDIVDLRKDTEESEDTSSVSLTKILSGSI